MGLKIRSCAKGAYYLASGTLVGSTVLLNGGVRRFITFTAAPVHEAVRMASLNPANLLGLGRRTGSLEAGKSANMRFFRERSAKSISWREGTHYAARVVFNPQQAANRVFAPNKKFKTDIMGASAAAPPSPELLDRLDDFHQPIEIDRLDDVAVGIVRSVLGYVLFFPGTSQNHHGDAAQLGVGFGFLRAPGGRLPREGDKSSRMRSGRVATRRIRPGSGGTPGPFLRLRQLGRSWRSWLP